MATVSSGPALLHPISAIVPIVGSGTVFGSYSDRKASTLFWTAFCSGCTFVGLAFSNSLIYGFCMWSGWAKRTAFNRKEVVIAGYTFAETRVITFST